MTRALLLALLASTIALAGCGHPAPAPQDLDSLDRELTDTNSAGNARDPVLTAALADQIMVDPALVQTSNAHAIRPPTRPMTDAIPADAAGDADPVPVGSLRPAPAPAADCPDCKARAGTLTIGALAQRQRDARTAACATRAEYSMIWSTRLPAAIPLHPGARVSEAAGTDTGGCRFRVVSFAVAAVPGKAIDFYYTRAIAAGFSAEAQAQGTTRVLGGTRGDAAFVVYATPRAGGGSTVDLVVNGG